MLADPGREMHVLELVRGSQDAADDSTYPGARIHEAGLEALDATARAAYRQRVAELRGELEEAERFNDAERCERLRFEIEAIAEQLAAAVGLGGRDRTRGSAAERARSTATKRFEGAIKAIRAVRPPLGAHLDGRVWTGTFLRRSSGRSQQPPVGTVTNSATVTPLDLDRFCIRHPAIAPG